MKSIMSSIFGLTFALAISVVAHAHAVVFETKEVDKNTIRINLKWAEEGETRGIYPIFYQLEKAKIFTIDYEIREKENPDAFVEFDIRKCIPPLRIILRETGENARPLFSDVKGSYAEEYIYNLHGAGIVNGMPDGSFRPYDPVTRAEFMTMLCKILKLDTSVGTVEFLDIKEHWSKGAMQAGLNKGLIKGYYDNTMRPDKEISIAEACVLIDKAFTFKSAREGYYQKLQRGKWFSTATKKIFDAAVLTVDDPIYRDFDEDKLLNRSDIAMMLSRAYTTF